MPKVIITNISKTTYDNETYWIEYKVNDKFGYEISSEDREFKFNDKFINKKDLSICSSYLKSIINKCLESDNEMFFEEYEDFNKIISGDNTFLDKLKKEIAALGIQDVIIFDEDGCAITVYGEVITRFLF
ncbi:hypothetical protein FDA33_10060 [Clostridium botulinum]|uniref:Uncharacterized protein n=1 Tax=Clostridium botulinum TaxID=1491 RepID=A0A0M1LCV6_CLOBO|nr:hypothetical protein [Clostridium botulinum]ALT05343.1 hypothetical protein [Clostridium botulinum]ALT05464.1 hypothetical protein [Clostridium botulinum]ALT05562.1 hypothetical protein [Clostridium botulinum]ALT05653.1 hypothetical protein [Clostridium botulinum]ALT05755.1 hypothetical protein [Clostridium botulinum]